MKINNIPLPLLEANRWFPTNKEKNHPMPGWSTPENQMSINEALNKPLFINGNWEKTEFVGFDITGHDINPDYLVLDWDNVIDPQTGEWISDEAKRIFEWILKNVPTFTERSVSKKGLHMIFLPTPENCAQFAGIHRLYFIEGNKDTKLEIFYKTGGRYFLFTGDCYCCAPNSPIASGEKVDKLFSWLIKKVQEQKSKKTEVDPALVYDSRNNYDNARSDNQIINAPDFQPSKQSNNQKNYEKNSIEYDRARAVEMLYFIDPSIGYNDWLYVGMALKNIGCSVHDWDNWSKKSSKYKPDECYKKWQSFDRSGIGIGFIHDLAKNGGYNEFNFKKEYYKNNPNKKTQPKTEKTQHQNETYDYKPPEIIIPELENLKKRLELVKAESPNTLNEEIIAEFLKTNLTDEDCSLIFRKVFDNSRFNHDTQSWFKFEDCKWLETKDNAHIQRQWIKIAKWAALQAEIDYETLKHSVRPPKYLLKKKKNIMLTVVNMLNYNRITRIVNHVKNLELLSVNDSDFNSNPFLFNTKNATIDLKKMQVTYNHNPYDYCTMVANVNLDKLPNTAFKSCKEWDEFIESAFPDPETRAYVQKYMGYCMTGGTDDLGGNPEDVFFFLYGQGCTGKTTFVETMKNIFGDYAKSFPIEYLTASKREQTGDEPSPVLYGMRHCRLAITSETKKNRKFDIDKIKRWTGKDTINARTLYKPTVEFKPQFKILITGNFAPKVEDIYDTGLRRRLRIIPMNNKPKVVNTQLNEIFARPENKTAIFTWVLQGAIAYFEDKKNGINPFDEKHLPSEVKKELLKFYAQSDSIPTFVEDNNITFNANDSVRVKDIYTEYLTWCKLNNERSLRRNDFIESILNHYRSKGVKLVRRTEKHEPTIFTGLGT